MIDLSRYKAKDNKTVREHSDDVIQRAITLHDRGYIKEERIYNMLLKACEYHDYGKINREFQHRIECKTKFDVEHEISHNVLSIYFIDPRIDDYEIIACSVLFHHNYCEELDVMQNQKELINELLHDFSEDIYPIGNRMIKKIEELINEIDKTKYNKNPKLFEIKTKQHNELVKVKGLLHRCDYSASAETDIEYPADYLTDKLDNMMKEWQKEKPEAGWNELQEFCRKHTDDNIIVTAQTGMGKTEAGLWWMGDNKGFFILPLKTAINAIYDRVKDVIIKNENIDTRLGLLHSDTMSYYSHQDNETNFMDYYTKTKSLAMPLTISTLDQLFDFVFKYRGYEMKLVTLAYSKLVIDEIQMYSADILAYLVYGIRKIIELGGKVAILTATLSPFIKDILKEEAFMEDVCEAGFTNDMKRHNVKVIEDRLDCAMIADIYNKRLEEGKTDKILVVCNTAKKSQEVYRILNEEYGIEDINLLNNKFTKNDRAEKEKQIFEFGKTENTNDAGIWVATSIVEASLDIDFDILFTELSDINGLFQRLGRCNRKGKKSVEEYNCYVFTEIDSKILKRESNGKGFIDEYLYSISKEAILKVDGVLSEEDKMKIIDEHFTTEKVKNSPYYKRYEGSMQLIKSLRVGEDGNPNKLRDIDSEDVIPSPVYDDNREEINAIVNRLHSEDCNKAEKVDLMDRMRGFMVSVPGYEVAKSTTSQVIEVSKYNKVKVMQCAYDSKIGVRESEEGNVIFVS